MCNDTENFRKLQPLFSALGEFGDGLNIDFELFSSPKGLSKDEFEACLQLVKTTSGQDYASSSIGWNAKTKRKEMQHNEMMYMLVRPAQADAGHQQQAEHETPGHSPLADTRILGFMSFMFDFDDPPNEHRPVVYLYEIHLDTVIQGKGIGSRLLEFVEEAARVTGITKTMLTVFNVNKKAKTLYQRVGYVRDNASPKDRVTRNNVFKPDYEIMSKELD